MKFFYFFGVILFLNKSIFGLNNFTSRYEWHYLDWNFTTDADRQNAINNGEYDPTTAIATDTDVYYYPENQAAQEFVAVPRLRGVPATLNTIIRNPIQQNAVTVIDPLLEPYPSWSWHQNLFECPTNRLVSVFRIQIDTCNRLWVLDSGTIGAYQVCPPQLIAFDPPTGNVLYQYQIPNAQIPSIHTLETPIVDVRDNCNNTFVYMADSTNFNLLVYDLAKNQSWRIRNRLFAPNTTYTNITINGQSIQTDSGILGMSLSPYKSGSDRTLYFHSLSSITENHVPTSVIRNQSLFTNNMNAASNQFQAYSGERPSQASAEAMSQDGVLFFGAATPTSIMCWNSAKDFVSSNLDTVAQNSQTLQFASGVKVRKNPAGIEEVVILTNSLQKFMTGTLNTTDINIRIQKIAVNVLVQGTKCDTNVSFFQSIINSVTNVISNTVSSIIHFFDTIKSIAK